MTSINIFETNPSVSAKPVLVVILDDGADYGIRGPTTSHYLGRLFVELNLDALFVVKNALFQFQTELIQRILTTIRMTKQSLKLLTRILK